MVVDEQLATEPLTMQFCAVSIGDRHSWVQYCRRVASALPPISADDDRFGETDTPLSTLPQDIKDQLRKANERLLDDSLSIITGRLRRLSVYIVDVLVAIVEGSSHAPSFGQ